MDESNPKGVEYVYEQLADKLNSLPNGFPRTSSGIEILLLKKIFSLEEALIATQLGNKEESVPTIAKRVGLPENEVLRKLQLMFSRGLVWSSSSEGLPTFRLAPFIVGFCEEELLRSRDHELAYIIEMYLREGGAKGIIGAQPPLHRVIPAQKVIREEQILPYDDVKLLFENAKFFYVQDCVCRIQQMLIGNRCEFPLHNCLRISFSEELPNLQKITCKEALSILEEAEEIGLVHTISNVVEGVEYICNCCSCCCEILRGITTWGINGSVAKANYFATIDSNKCKNCGQCIKRCPVKAISTKNDEIAVRHSLCIGCGLCVTGCPNGAIKLHLKPPTEIAHPPINFKMWEEKRVRLRGL